MPTYILYFCLKLVAQILTVPNIKKLGVNNQGAKAEGSEKQSGQSLQSSYLY